MHAGDISVARSVALACFALACGDSGAASDTTESAISRLCAKDAQLCAWAADSIACEDRYLGFAAEVPAQCVEVTRAYFECHADREAEPCWDYGHRADTCRPEADALIECVPKEVQWICPYSPDACGECRYANCCALELDCTEDLACATVFADYVRCLGMAQDDAQRTACRDDHDAQNAVLRTYHACLDDCGSCP